MGIKTTAFQQDLEDFSQDPEEITALRSVMFSREGLFFPRWGAGLNVVPGQGHDDVLATYDWIKATWPKVSA